MSMDYHNYHNFVGYDNGIVVVLFKKTYVRVNDKMSRISFGIIQEKQKEWSGE